MIAQAVTRPTPQLLRGTVAVPLPGYRLTVRRVCQHGSRLVPRAEQQPGQQPTQQASPPATPNKALQDLPPWIRREKERELQAKEGSTGVLPWPLLLLFSSFVAIASVGSVFEYVNKNALFGVLQPDNPLWAPILGLFALTGLPTAGLLFVKAVAGFNEEAERQDRLDGYR